MEREREKSGLERQVRSEIVQSPPPMISEPHSIVQCVSYILSQENVYLQVFLSGCVVIIITPSLKSI